MPSLSASSQSNVRMAAPALMTWLSCLAALCSVACRDTREDTNYCSSCASGENADGTATGSQEGPPPSSESAGTSTLPSSSSAGRVPTSTTPSNQAGNGNGNGSQGASAAAPSGGASAASGSSSVPAAGTRGQQAGAAARDAQNGQSGAEPDAGNGDNGPGPRDAGREEPMQQPEPTPDAGQMPVLPCNGSCPNERPVCDESKPVPQCVQCTAEEQFACIGSTSTCDVAQQKCVQCTPEDARNCDDETPVCNRDNRCVVCTSDLPASCPVAQPLCDNERRCVECMPGRTENCLPERSMCNEDGRCVECMNDAQCLDPARPRCDTGTNSCIGCEGASDCNPRFPNMPHCDAETKACVACSPTGELCPVGQYCDRGRYQCVPGTPILRNCERCRSDAECADSASIAACIQRDNDRFCFTATLSVAPLCEQGYVAATDPSRPNAMYCMPISSMSCTAINNALANKSCMSPADDCGKGGQCPMPDNICKQTCNSDQECPATFYCDRAAKVCKRL